jgi:hypothetical protein
MQMAFAMQHLDMEQLEAVRGGADEGQAQPAGGYSVDSQGYATTRGIQGHPLEQNQPDYKSVRGNNDSRGQWI